MKIPLYDSAGFLNGCLPADEKTLQLQSELQDKAVPFATLYSQVQMPILKWDSDWEQFLKQRGNTVAEMLRERTRCIFPWKVLKHIPKEQKTGELLYFSQGNRPSCMGHADDFAYRSSILSCIGLGSPLIYEPTNPYYTWVLSKGGSQSGGQSPTPMARAANETGHFTVEQVGNDNTSFSSGYKNYLNDAAKRQSAIIFIEGKGEELAQRIVAVVKAGFGVALGNSLAVSGTSVDSNGVEVAELGGSWAHATSFAAWFGKSGQEYLFWVNSHGKIYKKSTFGEPFDGAWMRTNKELVRFVSSATVYGQPYAVIPEAVYLPKKKLEIRFECPVPV
jgi:hypothetical protein